MKRTNFIGVFAVALAFGFAACTNDANTDNATTDATSTAVEPSTVTTTNTASTNNYTALADTFRTNSEAGNYLNPRTGKSFKLSIDTATGTRMNAETGEPVWHYVDKRNLRVYGGENWDTVGAARMEGNKLTYQGDNDKWVNYDDRWKSDDERMTTDWKKKYGDTKIKISKDGDVKIKDENGKVKYDADDNKVKVDSSR